MPLYYFECSGCGLKQRRILTAEEAKQEHRCVCGEALRRTPKPPTTQVTEVLDNGLMPKRLERLAEAERLYKERSRPTKPEDTNV